MAGLSFEYKFISSSLSLLAHPWIELKYERKMQQLAKQTDRIGLSGLFNIVSRDDDSRSTFSAQTHQVIPDSVQFKRKIFVKIQEPGKFTLI